MSKPMMRSKPARRGGLDRADDAAGGTGEDRILALEGARVGEAAVRLHEHEARASPSSPATWST